MLKETLPSLKVSTGWIPLEIISEPDVVLTFRGYAPILRVQKCRTGVEYSLYISAKSLAEPLEELRKNNDGILREYGYEFVRRAWNRCRNMKLR